MNIAICDDNKVYVDIIANVVSARLSELNSSFSISKYTSGDIFLQKHIEEPFDVVFLDIVMPDSNGFDIARIIRQKSEKTIIVFVTTENQLVYSSFNYRPFNFIPKKSIDSMKTALIDVIGKIVDYMQTVKSFFLELPYGEYFQTCPSDIVYITSKKNYSDIFISSGETIRVRKSLNEMTAFLPEKYFSKTHNRYLINMSHVKKLDLPNNEVIMTKNINIAISRSYKNEFIERYMAFMRETV